MVEAIKTESGYEAAFRELEANADRRPAWLERLRQAAAARFQESGFPPVEDEEWKYTNVAPLARIDFTPIVRDEREVLLAARSLERFSCPESNQSRLVFVNGIPRFDLSCVESLPIGVFALSFGEALKQERYAELLREYLGRIVAYDENGFTALNTALLANGMLLHFERNARLSLPLQLLFITDPQVRP